MPEYVYYRRQYHNDYQFNIKTMEIDNQQTAHLLACIRSTKDKFKRNQYFKIVANRPAHTPQEYQEKIRSMNVAFDALVQQNRQLHRLQSNYEEMLKDKDRTLELTKLQISKYRDQLVDVLNKNEDLGNYSRKLALEYNTLMNSLKQSDEVAFERQLSQQSKLSSIENQLTFLRKKVLDKQNDNEIKRIMDSKTKGVTRIKSKKTMPSKTAINQNNKSHKRKSLADLKK